MNLGGNGLEEVDKDLTESIRVTLPEIATAIWFVLTIKETSIPTVNNLFKRLENTHKEVYERFLSIKMHEIIIPMQVQVFNTKYQKKSNDKVLEIIRLLALNFYYNSALLEEFAVLYDLRSVMQCCIDFKNEIFEKEISYYAGVSEYPAPCYFKNCNGHLKTTNRKSPSILFDNIYGPTLCKTFSKQCNVGKAIHKHNTILKNDVLYLIRPNSKFFQSTTESIFHDALLDEFGRLNLRDGVSAESYASVYNSRHYERILKIQNILINRNGNVAHRGQSVYLEPQRLTDSYYARMVIKFIYTNILKGDRRDEVIKISLSEIQTMKVKKQLLSDMMSNRSNKIKIKKYGCVVELENPVEWSIDNQQKYVGVKLFEPIGYHNGTVFGTKYFECKPNHGLILNADLCDFTDVDRLTHTSPDPEILFSILYDKYIKGAIYSIGTAILHAVPVKDGQPYNGHSCIYGDGNQKITHPICGLSPTLYDLLHYEETSKYSLLSEKKKEYYQCDNPFYTGNQFARSSSICPDHVLLLISLTCLSLDDINIFSKWNYLQDEIIRVQKKKDNEVALKHLHENMQKISSNKRILFEQVITLLGKLTKLAKDRYHLTKNNIHHNYTVDKDSLCMLIIMKIYVTLNHNIVFYCFDFTIFLYI